MRFISFLIVIVAGAAVLVSLGMWQVQRLAWKQEFLDAIEARIGSAPAPLPQVVDQEQHQFMPVRITGQLGAEYVRVLSSPKQVGVGYRIISSFDLGDRVILVDRGFIHLGADMPATPAQQVSFVGNLHWPQETDSFTPPPDLGENIWFAREVGALAQHFGAEAVLVVASKASWSDGNITPWPVSTAGIPNDHFQYAVTWFLLAVVWLGMGGYFLYAGRAKKEGM